MDFKRALIVDSPSDEVQAGVLQHLVDLLAANGLQISTWYEADVLDAIRQATRSGEEPVLTVLAPGLSNPIPLGRAIRSMWSGTHLLFIGDGERTAGLRQALGRTPMLGYHWSLAEFGDKALGEQVRNAVTATRRRAQLRTTLDGVNARLALRPAGVEEARRVMSEHYLTNFLAQANESILAADAGGRVLYWNASAQQLLGMDEHRIAHLVLQDLPFWSPRLAVALASASERPDTARCELVYQRGREEMVLEAGCSTVRDRQGNIVGTMLVIRDMSERHRSLEAEREEHRLAESVLMRERARVLELFDLAPGFMALTQGKQHVVELANPAFSQIFGKRDLPGMSLHGALSGSLPQDFFHLLDRVYDSGTPHVASAFPVAVQAADGAERHAYLDFVLQPVTSERGRVTGVFWQGADVTTQKQAQDALLEQQNQLERMVSERTASLKNAEQALLQAQKLESLGKLTGGVAHDFNNILQIIGGNLELLKGQVGAGKDGRGRLDVAAEAVDRGAKLASQLLAFARKQPLAPVATNLARIVRDMDSLLRRALGDSVQVETVIGGGLWNALVDRNQLENVILNLAINGRDAMDGHGRLTIELGNALLDDHYAEANSEVEPGQYVMLAVSDTGSGMPPEVVARVFEPFYTTKPEGRGTGLGLSMAYGFVKQSAGHIKIYSEPGNGTTIKVYLPRTHQAEAAASDFRPLPAVGGSETILVVEDDAAVRATVVDLLTDLGYTVLKAGDGQSGLNVLQSGMPIDMLFTDVVMPGPVRSTELARHAKELHPEIRVLFTSGYTQNAIVHGGRLDPGVELISKPYRREDLARKIRALLAPKGEPRPAQPAPAAAGGAPGAAPRKLSVLVVEDNADGRLMLCELLDALGYVAIGAESAEQALARLAGTRVDVLLTDVGLPGMDGKQLARLAARDNPGLKVIFASGFGAVEIEGLPSLSLTKPYKLQDLEDVLARI